MVIIIVFFGLIFSGIQFYISLQTSLAGKKAQNAEAAPNPSPEVAEFEASLQGVKVKSSVLGIIILSISLAFFYLYLAHVYPIFEAGEAPTASATP